MYAGVADLLQEMTEFDLRETGIIEWACPVPFFGQPANARVATVGLNPSNNEFVTEAGYKLALNAQRLPTLQSLQLASWSDATTADARRIVAACRQYFLGNPYNRWFGVLERLLAPSGLSYYGRHPGAFHIDIVPWATEQKWGQISGQNQRTMLTRCAQSLAQVLQNASSLEVVVLNGRSAVRHFEALSGHRLVESDVDEWALRRSSGNDVYGISYEATIETFGGYALRHPLKVIGYNHNLQSSFGVSKRVLESISRWVTDHSNRG